MIWIIKKMFYRSYQCLLKSSLLILVKLFPEPKVLAGPGSVNKLPEFVKSHGVGKALIVTDKILSRLGLLKGLLDSLKKADIKFIIFDDVQQNPTIQNVEAGLKVYIANACDGIIAFGGGSPMDCAKIIGARFVNKRRSVRKMKGMFKVFWKLPPFFAVPTTAGTGSETTIAAVVSDPETHEKFALIDLKFMPLAAVLDPELMLGLPPHVTSTTGMDALTHAIEAYIGWHGTKFTNENSEKAVKMILDNLEKAYKDGTDLDRRMDLAYASFYAGKAFTRASVGYVHAIAHNIGGHYGVPHGLANAVILPYILEFSRKKAEKKLAKLAIAGGIGKNNESDEELSLKFIEKIKTMNKNMNIPTFIKELRAKDIPTIAERALNEAHPGYPVPVIMNRKECEILIGKLLPKN